MSSDVPVPFLTELGWTVDGAGPELLEDLLERYERVWLEESPHLLDSLRPGRTDEDIRAAIGGLGLPVHPELLVWWRWHDGWNPGPEGFTLSQLSLQNAVDFYPYGEPEDGPRPIPGWLPVCGSGVQGLSLFTADPYRPAMVRFIDIWMDGATTQPEHTESRAVSLSTIVAMWLVRIERGSVFWDDDGTGARWYAKVLPAGRPADEIVWGQRGLDF